MVGPLGFVLYKIIMSDLYGGYNGNKFSSTKTYLISLSLLILQVFFKFVLVREEYFEQYLARHLFSFSHSFWNRYFFLKLTLWLWQALLLLLQAFSIGFQHLNEQEKRILMKITMGYILQTFWMVIDVYKVMSIRGS